MNDLSTNPVQTVRDFDENLASIELLPDNPEATFYFLPNGIGKDRRAILTDACEHFRLVLVTDPHQARYILADEQFDARKVISMVKLDSTDDEGEHALPTIVRIRWLSDSLKAKHLVPLTKDYTLRSTAIRKETTPSFSRQSTVGAKNDLLRKEPKRRLSDDEPRGGSATQIKQRRYSSDDDDHDLWKVRVLNTYVRLIHHGFSLSRRITMRP